MIGENHRGNAQGGPLARLEMLEGLGHVALFADPVPDLGVHEPTLASDS
jgi:hypothetical protein